MPEYELSHHRHGATDDYPFRRSWAWWRFDAPERRDYSQLELVQLGKLGILTERERAILKDRENAPRARDVDDPTYWCRHLTDAERALLGFPNTHVVAAAGQPKEPFGRRSHVVRAMDTPGCRVESS